MLVMGDTLLRHEEPVVERPNLARTVLSDPHFWIPVLVLLIGLAVLRWIS